VSIVTPVLNGALFLPDCLASVRVQSHPRVEHIVVDGGSTDGTLDIVRAAGVRWTSATDAGMYDAINRGFRMAEGDVLAYQNADDRYAGPDAVARAVARLTASPEVDVVYGGFRYIDAAGRAVPRPEVHPGPFDRRALLRYNFIPPHSTFVRSRLVKEQGHWLDASLRFPGDWDWFVRMALAGAAFASLPEVLSEFRLHEGTITRRMGWGPKLREWRRVCRKNGTSFPALLWHEVLWVPLKRRLGLVA
jgi:glycosyltransferase involved in cell wall biosynthesis